MRLPDLSGTPWTPQHVFTDAERKALADTRMVSKREWSRFGRFGHGHLWLLVDPALTDQDYFHEPGYKACPRVAALPHDTSVLSVLEKIKDMAESIKRECGYDCTDKRLFQVRPVSDSLPVFEVLFDERDIHHYETETFRRRSTMKKKGKQTTTRGMKTTASRVS